MTEPTVSLEDVTCGAAEVERVCITLKKFGVAAVSKFVAEEDLAAIRAEARTATEFFANYHNPYGPCSRFSLDELPPEISRSRDLSNGTHLQVLPDCFVRSRKCLSGDFFRRLTRNYLGPECGFMEVVAFTKDCIPDKRAVYGKLHFDRRHQLKAILYLNDVGEWNGAFGCVPGSHELGQALYRQGWSRTLGLKFEDGNIIDRVAAAVPEDCDTYLRMPCIVEGSRTLPESDPQRRLSVSGCAGTLVVFDTHLLHNGGFVKKAGQERWTLKGHTLAISSAASERKEYALG